MAYALDWQNIYGSLGLDPDVCFPDASLGPIVTSDMDRQRSRDLLAFQNKLQHDIPILLDDLRDGYCDPGQIQRVLGNIQEDASSVAKYLSPFIPSESYNELGKPGSDAAQNVFNTTELLENILNHFDVFELMNFYRVNRRTRDVIEGSPDLLKKMGLRAKPANSFLELPFKDSVRRKCTTTCLWEGSRCRCDDYYGPRKIRFSCNRENYCCRMKPPRTRMPVSLRATFYPSAEQHLPRIGSRWRSMYICQPPIQKIQAHVTCCQNSQQMPVVHDMSSSQSTDITAMDGIGITIGDLYNFAEATYDKHRYCPMAPGYRINPKNGAVRIDSTFKAMISMEPNDPMLMHEKAEMGRSSQRSRDSLSKDIKMQEFAHWRREGEFLQNLTCSVFDWKSTC